jgi:hypothetical protein
MLTRSTGILRISLRPALALATGVLCAACVAAVPAIAQQQPEPFPWERDANKFFNQGIPKVDNPLDRNFRESLRKLGLPDQPSPDQGRETEPEPEPPGLSRSVMPQLDGDRDGYVSRGEYFSSRQRAPMVGNQGTQRHLQRRERIDSRFRAADRNRDGRLSPAEIDEMEGRRF